jgi:beta-glucosidase
VTYSEGNAVGYRWFAGHPSDPVEFPFGFGLSYTQFRFSDLKLTRASDGDITAHVTVRNVGSRPGVAVAEFYETSVGGVSTRRLAGFARVLLAPGQIKEATSALNERVLANFDEARHEWRIPGGTLEVAVGDSAINLLGRASMRMKYRDLGP